jgi:hypothetical protein
MSFSTKAMLENIRQSVPVVLFILVAAISAIAADFDRDGKADFAVFRQSNATWHTDDSAPAGSEGIRWGNPTDVLVPADYDGDGKTDLAVWRPENGVWYIQQSGDGGALLVKWGMTTNHPTGGLPDVPVPADFDGDSRADLAVWRPDTGEWWILSSTTDWDQTRPTVVRWGKLGDVPVQGDYDGNGRADYAIFRPSNNEWWIRDSVASKSSVITFGLAGLDTLVPADYNGDRKTDVAVYRSGVWYVFDMASHEVEPFHLGFNDDAPVPADYDGDGSVDFATYRSGTWYVYESKNPRLRSFNFGQATDIPVSSGVVRESIVAVP